PWTRPSAAPSSSAPPACGSGGMDRGMHGGVGAGIGANDLQRACSRLAHAFAFVAPPSLTSQARQAAAARAWAAIQRFSATCQAKRPGRKGSPHTPRFQHHCRSVAYTGTGWTLDPDGRHLTLTDGCAIGRVRLLGTRARETCPVE